MDIKGFCAISDHSFVLSAVGCLLLLLFFVFHLNQGMSTGGKKTDEPSVSTINTFGIIGLPTQMNKKKTGSLLLQICCVELCNFLNSSVSKILCLQNGAKKCCPLESIFKTSYEKCLVVCLVFTSAAVLLNLFLPGESVFYKVR